jgi:tetratricopeptide (TPR) repeat protein
MRAVWPVSAVAERRRWLQAALESVDERTPPLVAANLEHSVATVAYMFGEFQAALAGSGRLMVVFRDLGDPLGEARAQFLAGRSLTILGRIAEGEPLLRRSLEASRALGNTPLAGLALAGLARSRSMEGDLPGARDYLAQAFAIYEATGADAYSVLVESAAAGIEFRAGNVERAVQLSTASLATMRGFGLTLFVTIELNALAAYLIGCRRWQDARARAREALELAQETQQLVEVVWSLQHLAVTAVLSVPNAEPAPSTLAAAARLLGYVDARISALGTSRQFMHVRGYDLALAMLRDAIGSEQTRRWMLSGSEYTADQALEAGGSL